MSCSKCKDSSIPTSLSVGSDGKSCTVAFASDNAGTDFSYIASDSLPFISVVCKVGAVTASDFTTWVEYIGTDGNAGTDGTDGVSVNSSELSDGVTAIGGTVYPEHSLIIGLDNGTYLNAGIIPCCADLNWIAPILESDWAAATADFAPINIDATVYYAIDTNGFLHLRGILDSKNALSGKFVTGINFGNSSVIVSSISETIVSPTSTTESLTTRFELGITTLSVTGWDVTGGRYWMLDSVPPIYIR